MMGLPTRSANLVATASQPNADCECEGFAAAFAAYFDLKSRAVASGTSELSHRYLHVEFGQDWLTRLTIIMIARWADRAAPSCQPTMWLQWSPAK
jgi:hypothetical protein